MRIVHTGDWHLGKNLEGLSRLEEQAQFLNDFIHMVEENKIDMVMIAGDIYDCPNPPAKAEQLFYETLEKLSLHGERIILVIAGNHDSPERLCAAEPLARHHGIIIAGTPKTIIPVGKYGKHEVTESGEGFLKIRINQETAVVLMVPYPSEKRLNEMIYEKWEEEEKQQNSYSDRIKMLFSKQKKHYEKDTINLAMAHLFVTGSKEGGSERGLSLGGCYLADASCFPKEAQYVALGHVHKPQIISGMHQARYSGSPIPYNKKEAVYQKKVWIVDVEPGQEAKITEQNLKTYKPIEIWKCRDFQEALEKCKENSERDCYVYLEIRTDSYIMEEQIKELRNWKKDIVEILPVKQDEEPEQENENLEEQSFEEIFTGFYKKERGAEPEEELVTLLLSVLSEEA